MTKRQWKITLLSLRALLGMTIALTALAFLIVVISKDMSPNTDYKACINECVNHASDEALDGCVHRCSIRYSL